MKQGIHRLFLLKGKFFLMIKLSTLNFHQEQSLQTYFLLSSSCDMNKTKKQEAYQSVTTSKGNRIWTPLMPLVWNHLQSTFTNQSSLQFEHPNKQAQFIIKSFNNSHFSEDILPKDTYYLRCGFGKETVNLINKEVKKRFEGRTLKLQQKLDDKDFISYAYLYQSVSFINHFERRKNRTFRFNNRPVQSFYAKHYQQKQQIKCYFYQDCANFIISIRLKNHNSSFFIIKNRKIQTVKAAIGTVESSISNKKTFNLAKIDKFEMPLITLSCLRKYQQLEGLVFKNKEIQGYMVKKMYEQYKLDINECGAILEGQAVLVGFKCPSIPGPRPREFLLDESFWIVLKQEGQHPYFCAYINNESEQIAL